MNTRTMFKKLNLKPLSYKFACLILGLVPLAQGALAVYIFNEEKEHVIRELEDCLRNDAVFMSDIPKYQNIGLIADNFGRAWDFAKNAYNPEHTVLGVNNQDLWGQAAQTYNRERFMSLINQILGDMFSHLAIVDAQEDLAKELDRYKDVLGITYRESTTKTSDQEYVVLTVHPGGKADLAGVRPNDRFCLCEPKSVTMKYTKLPNGKTKETLTINFYRGTRHSTYARPIYLAPIVCDYVYTDQEGNYINHFDPDRDYLRQLEEWYKLTPSDYLRLKLNSFSTGEYDGEAAAAILEFARLHHIKNLVIDLRGNGGGSVWNLNHLLSFFIRPNETYGISVTKDVWNAFRTTDICKNLAQDAMRSRGLVDSSLFKHAVSYFKDNHPTLCNFVPLDTTTARRQLFTGKVTIFIDGNTASAAEDFTAVLKGFLGTQCKIIGQKSSGALLTVQRPRYAGSFKVVYPYQDYLPINGMRVEKQGIQPDVTVRDSTDTEVHYDEAKKWFRAPDLISPRNLVGGQAPRANGRPFHVTPRVPRSGPSLVPPIVRETRKGIIVDSYWVAFVNQDLPDRVNRIKLGNRVYSVGKPVIKRFSFRGGTSVVLMRVSTPISEISRDYNYRYGVGDIPLPLGLPNDSGDFLDVVGAGKGDQDRLYSKNIRTWMDSIVLKDACR